MAQLANELGGALGGSVLDTAGWIMVEGGSDPAQGLVLLRKAARLAPTNAAIADHLAKASRKTPSPG